MGKRKPEDLDLEYLNGRIDRLHQKFNEFSAMFWKWKKEDRDDIDELKKTRRGE